MLRPNILIADDHPLLLRGLEEFLREKNYQIIATCTDGLSAYNTIIKEKPDIAILDIEMPNMTGIDIAKNCKRHPACICHPFALSFTCGKKKTWTKTR